MAITKNSNSNGFSIGVSCPGCGGQLTLDNNFFAVQCKHCGSSHRIQMPDTPPAFSAEVKVSTQKAKFEIDRYLKSNGLPLTSSDYELKKMYYPYWKIDAVLFRVRKGIEKHVVVPSSEEAQAVTYEKETSDISLSPYTTTIQAGMEFSSLPQSIGMRADYLKLFPLSDDKMPKDFDLLKVFKSWEEVRSSLQKNVGAISSIDKNIFGANKTEIHSPKAILIYFPFLIFDFYDDDSFNKFVIDGITGHVLNHETKPSYPTGISEMPVDIQFGELTIQPHRCNNCGVDLPLEKSLVYICHNCQVLTDLEPGVVIDEILQAVHQKNSHDMMIPFWSFKIKDISKTELRSVFGGIYNSDRVVVPAFQAHNYNALYRLTKRMSSAITQYDFEALTTQSKEFAPINLPLQEAIDLIRIFVQTDRYKKNLTTHSEVYDFTYESVTLFYAPFHLESYFYIDSVLNAVTFEKNLL